MSHKIHDNHKHVHSEQCGHTRIRHDGHVDYLHDGCLHSAHDGHYDEHVVAVNATNPAHCAPTACQCKHEQRERGQRECRYFKARRSGTA